MFLSGRAAASSAPTGGCGAHGEWDGGINRVWRGFRSSCLLYTSPVPTRAESQILLCGEDHTDAACREQELALWRERYAAGDRDLFLEMGAATAELLRCV